MTPILYSLNFSNYCIGFNLGTIPNGSGIYCVYTGVLNPHTGQLGIEALIYVGESENVHNRIAAHERTSEWLQMTLGGKELCFTYSGIMPADARRRAEAALIFYHKPLLNNEYKHYFPFGQTDVKTFGYQWLLNPYFRVS